MVAEMRPEYPSDWPAICAVASRLGIGSAETLRKWVRQAEVDAGQRPGVSSEESAELRKLRAEVRELRRANEILKAALALIVSAAGRFNRVRYRALGVRAGWVMPGLGLARVRVSGHQVRRAYWCEACGA
jgi:transposase